MKALNMLIYEFQIFNPQEDILFVYYNADRASTAGGSSNNNKKLTLSCPSTHFNSHPTSWRFFAKEVKNRQFRNLQIRGLFVW